MKMFQLGLIPDLCNDPSYPMETGAIVLMTDMDLRIFGLIDFGFYMQPPYNKPCVELYPYRGNFRGITAGPEGDPLYYVNSQDFGKILTVLEENHAEVSKTNTSIMKFCRDLPCNTPIIVWWEPRKEDS